MDNNQVDIRNIELLNQIANEAPTDEIKEIISYYSVNQDGTEIYNNMKSQSRSSILTTAQYLNVKNTSGKVTTLSKAIIKKLESHLLQKCAICKIHYHIKTSQKPIIECKICGQGCHDECYSALVPLPGVKFYCTTCDDDTDEVEEDPPNRETNIDTVKNTEQTSENTSDNTSQLKDDHYPQNNPNTEGSQICWRYRRGVCPNGISGETLVNGRKCNFAHPKRCQRYCQYGDGGENGCHGGRSCEFMHPILCKFSLKFRCCINLKCRFTHLKFTKRYRPRREEPTMTQPWAQQPTQDRTHENNVWRREDTKYNNEGRQHTEYNDQSYNHQSQSYHEEGLADKQYDGRKPQMEHFPQATAHGRENAQHCNRERQNVNYNNIKQNLPSQKYNQEIFTDNQNEADQGQRGMAFLIQLVQHVKEEMKKDMMDFKDTITAQIQQQRLQTVDQVKYQSTMPDQNSYQAPVQPFLLPPCPVIDQTQVYMRPVIKP